MKRAMGMIGITFSVVLLTSCAIDSGPAAQSPESGSGYTVGYGYSENQISYDNGGYVGYGGWASNYYSPVHRYGYWPSMYNGGH